MKGKRLLMIVFAGVLVFGLTGYGAGAKSSKLSGKLTIWSWGASDEKKAREDMVKVFQKAHPKLKITHVVLPTANSVWDQKSAAAYAAGNAADVMQMSPDYYGMMSKYWEDLTPYVKRDKVDLEAVTVKGMMDGYTRPNGKLDSLPLLANCFLFAYNKSLFDKAGVPYPTDNWTWDDLAKMAPKFVSGAGVNHTYFMVNHWVLPNFALICKGGQPYTGDFSKALVDSKEVAAGLDLFGKLIKEGAIPNDEARKNMPSEQLFVSGKAAIYPMGGFEIGQISREIGKNFKWGAVLPPEISNTGKNSNITYATGYAINAACKNKEAAWQFLKEACYANNAMAKVTARIGMPANKKIAESIYAKTTYGSVPNSKYLQGMPTSRLNLFGGSLATVGDLWKQMWEYVTIAEKNGADAQQKYFPLIAQAFEKLNIKE
jgi:multiple sugar transport system substrate-binding protein